MSHAIIPIAAKCRNIHYEILRMVFVAHFQGADSVSSKLVGPLLMTVPVSSIMAISNRTKSSRWCGRGEEPYADLKVW